MKTDQQVIDRNFATALEPLLVRRTKLPYLTIAKQLSQVLDVIDKWLRGLPAPTSLLAVRMFFLQQLCELLPEHSLCDAPEIVDVVLSGTGVCAPGDEFDRKRADGGVDHWKVLWRKIGSRFGIEMAMQDQNGRIMNGEFFD